MPTDQILQATTILLCLSLLLQSFEMLAIARQINSRHPWAWERVLADFKYWPGFVQHSLKILFTKNFPALIVAQILLLLTLLFFFHWLILFGIFITTLLINLRFRGVFNGGSDYMTLVVVIGLLMVALVQTETTLLPFGFYYIAIQCTLSYFIAGLVKLKNPSWRNGYALSVFFRHSNYNVPEFLRTLAQNPWFNRLSTWGVLLWECTFPMTWLFPKLIVFYLALGFVFHLGNFISFGLNRFLFAWIACYPAVFFCTQRGI